VLPALLAAAAVAWWSLGSIRPAVATTATAGWRKPALVSLATGVAIALLFYSSFLAHPAGALEPIRAAGTYFERGVGPGSHVHPWHYYLSLLGWSSSGGLLWTEALVLALAAVGAVTAWTTPDRSQPASWLTRVRALSLLAIQPARL